MTAAQRSGRAETALPEIDRLEIVRPESGRTAWADLIEPPTATRRRGAVSERALEEPSGHSLTWPEGLAVTTLLAALAVLASGAIDPMLPWGL